MGDSVWRDRGRVMHTPSETIKISIDMDVPLLRVADLICEAFEGGIGYWAKIVKYDRPKELKYTIDTLSNFSGDKNVYKHIDYPLNIGGAVYIEEYDDGQNGTVHKLNWESIVNGLSIMHAKYPRHFGDWIAENDDATTGDVFMQCCLLGEVVYG